MSGPSRIPARPSAQPKSTSRTPWVIGAVVALVAAVALLFAILAGGDDGDGGSDTTTPTNGSDASTAPGSEPGETQAVTITGDPLEALADPANDPAVGTLAPTLSGSSFDGTPVEITPGEGGPRLLVFLAHWCPHCQDEVPVLVDWHEQGGVPADLQVTAVATGTDDERPNYPPSEWLEDELWPWPVLADDEASSAGLAYGVSGFPFLVILDAEGNVAARVSGEVSSDQLEQLIAQSLGG